jgi:diguanylate cyclase (GGDEF)-like protein
METVNELGSNYAVQVSKALNSWIENQVKWGKVIVKDPRIIEACLHPENGENLSKATDYLKNVHEEVEYYENLALVSFKDYSIEKNIKGRNVVIQKDAILIDSVGGKTTGEVERIKDFLPYIKAGGDFFISDVYKSIYRENPIFVISIPVYDGDKIIGSLLLPPQMDYFIKLFVDEMKFGETGYFILGDSRGYVLAHPNRDYVLTVPDGSEGLLEKAVGGFEYTIEDFMGIERYYVISKLEIDPEKIESEWYIIYSQDMKEILKSYSRLKLISFNLVIVLSVLITSIMVFFNTLNEKKIKEEQLEKSKKKLELLVDERTKELKILVQKDSLTGLFNHKAIMKKLDSIIDKKVDENLSLGIVMMDIDNFKKINDKYGHVIGDEVLVKVSAVLNEFSDENCCIGRYGGEEFIIIFKDKNKSEVERISEEIRRSIELISYDFDNFTTTASFGYKMWSGEAVVDLIKKADDNMYLAKSKGKNRIEG